MSMPAMKSQGWPDSSSFSDSSPSTSIEPITNATKIDSPVVVML